MPTIDDPRLGLLKNRIAQTESESERLMIIKQLFKLIKDSSGSIVSKMDEGITIDNFDEVRATLANEFRRNTRILTETLKDIQLSNEEQSRIIAALMREDDRQNDGEFQTIRVKKSREKVHVLNFDDMPFPTEISVNNIQQVIDKLDELRNAFNIDIPAPEVTVQPASVNIPETNIQIPEANFDPVVSAINELRKSFRKLLNDNNNRQFSKLLDGLGNKLDVLTKATGQAFAAFPGQIQLASGSKIGIKAPKSITSGTVTVTTAGTAVQFTASSIVCDYVLVGGDTNNSDVVVVGDSSVVAAAGSQQGIILAGPDPVRIDTNNLSNLWADSISNGDKVSYAYFSS